MSRANDDWGTVVVEETKKMFFEQTLTELVRQFYIIKSSGIHYDADSEPMYWAILERGASGITIIPTDWE